MRYLIFSSATEFRLTLKQQIYWWYFNHTRSTTSGTDSRSVLKLAGSRVLQPYQAYSHLYYESKLKTIIEERYKEHLEVVPTKDQQSAFVFRTAETKALFDAETDEVKQEVEEYRQKKVEDVAIKIEDLIEDTDAQDVSSQAEAAELAVAMQS
jgi:hypothetical protein